MPYGREHRLESHKLQDLFDKLESSDLDRSVPGRQTHAELLVWMTGRLAGAAAAKVHWGPGRRTAAGVAMLGFHDFQALGLRDVLSRLGDRPTLRAATLAAADPEVARRVTARNHDLSVGGDPTTAIRPSLGLWRAAERRAVTLYRRAFATGMARLETPAVAAALAAIGAGAPLEPAVCREMEAILGVRLNRVRIHTGAVAREAAQAANADAFTVGEDIFLPSFDPTSQAGRKLLLHELVHCCQWWQGKIPASGHGISVSQPSDALEHEAEAVVARAPIGLTRDARSRQHHRGTLDSPGAAWRSPTRSGAGIGDRSGSGTGRMAGAAPPITAARASSASGAVGFAPSPHRPATALPLVMRQAKSHETASIQNAADDEWLAWIDMFLKGEYRWQVVIQDLFRSSLWASQEQVDEVAREDAEFITENRGVIFTSLAVFLGVGAVAVFASGATAAVCTALLVGFGVAGFVVTSDAMLKHAVRWLQLVRRANGQPEGIAAASREFIHMMVSLAMAVEAAAGVLDLTKLAPTVARWLQAKSAAPKRHAPKVSLTDDEQAQLLAARPLAGMSPSGDLKTGGWPDAGGDKDLVLSEATLPHLGNATTAAQAQQPPASVGATRLWQWRTFTTADGDFLINIDAKNLEVLNRVVKEGGLTWKQIQQALGHKGPPSAVARNFAAVVNKRLQLGKRDADADLEDIGHLAYDPPSQKYVYRGPGQSQKTQRAKAEFAALTTMVRQPITLPGAGEVWIRATPIQHALLRHLVTRDSWKRTELVTYLADTWRNIIGPLNLLTQLLALRISLRFARTGRNTTDKIVYAGQLRFEGTEDIRFIPPITHLLPVKFGDIEYWFLVKPAIQKILRQLSNSEFGVSLGKRTAKTVRVALNNARLKDDVGAPTHVVGDLIFVDGSGAKSSTYLLERTTETRAPSRKNVRSWADLIK